MSSDDKTYRSQILSELLYELSATNGLTDKSLDRMAKDVEEIYSDGYRQQYSDLLNMLIEIEDRLGSKFNSQDLCDNLEQLSEYIRISQEADGSYRYNADAFLGITKLADHISLELQRDDDYRILIQRIRKSQSDLESMSEAVGKARKEAQSSKVELVAILSIFAALVIAFSGGVSILGGAISGIGQAELQALAFVVLLCGIVLFNTVAFLMHVVFWIIRRLHDSEGPENRLIDWKYILGFNVLLLVLLGITLCF